jgi:pyrimidine operon attenuation protein/uracil phosphoribosyltransferase
MGFWIQLVQKLMGRPMVFQLVLLLDKRHRQEHILQLQDFHQL